eukprot:129629_1
MEILSKSKLSGLAIREQPFKNTKLIIQPQLSMCMTEETFQIIMEDFKTWRMQSMDDIKDKSAAEVAYQIYNFPLNNLINRINTDNIDGYQFIQYYTQDNRFIKEETGWNETEIYQIESILFDHYTYTEQHFKQNMSNVLSNNYSNILSKTVINAIQNLFLQTNVEQLHFQIKHGRNIEGFSEKVTNMIYDLVQNNDENANVPVKKIYEAIAKCFILTHDVQKTKNTMLISQPTRKDWLCSNCSNYNFHNYIGGEINTDLSLCLLCGVQQIDCIIMKLKDADTFVMTNEVDFNDETSTVAYALHFNTNDKVKVKMKDLKLVGTIRWIGKSDQWAKGIWYGIELDSESLLYGHNGYYNGARFFGCPDKYGIYVQQHQIIQKIEKDDIDLMIEDAMKSDSFVLSCPNRTDNVCCPCMIRLVKYLIIYKRWLHTVYKKTKGNDGIEKTIQIDISKNVNNEIYKQSLISCATSMTKIKENDMNLLIKMFDNNVAGIGHVTTFLKMKRKTFYKCVSEHTKIKPAHAAKLYTNILNTLTKIAQTKQFGLFLSDLDMNVIDEDYYHILKIHINDGNKESIKNAFRFFERIVHYEDSGSEIEECRSVKRRNHRSNDINKKTETIDEKKNDCDEKNIWKLKQYYNQSQLDMIHSYLVHSNW